MELIEKKAAMDCCFKPQVRPNEEIFNALKMEIRSEISALQSVDNAPVVHGKWTTKRTQKHDGEWYCTACDYEPIVMTDDMKYCPGCGAKMDLEDEQ